ncbi:DUF3313 family protein [Aurantivibrio plasticivorans]
MNNDNYAKTLSCARVLFGALSLVVMANVVAAEDEGALSVSHDGLEVVTDKRNTEVHLLPDVDWSKYGQYMLVEPQVSFKENWQRDYNREQRSLTTKVKDKDMLRIKRSVADNMSEILTDVLSEKSDLTVVQEAASGVLLLKPIVTNLDVTAPDLQTATRSKTYVRSAGSATISLEIYDSVSGAILGRWIDRRTAPDYGYAQWATRTSNRREARLVIRHWAERLVEGLQELRQ